MKLLLEINSFRGDYLLENDLSFLLAKKTNNRVLYLNGA